MHRIVGDSRTDDAWMGIPPADLIVTSPPAYPSPRQSDGALGTEATLGDYARGMIEFLKRARRCSRLTGHLVLVLQPLDAQLMEVVAQILARLGYHVNATYRWSHGNGDQSYVVFLAIGNRARLNQKHPAWSSQEWAIPVREPVGDYTFYEWPDELVEAIVGLTIPDGGVVVDPFCGRAQALNKLPGKYRVYGMDSDGTLGKVAGKARMAMENPADVAGGEVGRVP